MKKRLISVLVAIVVATFVPMFHSAPASAASAGDFLSKINGLRASKGLGALSTDGRLSGTAQRWADQMAANGGISHNPGLSSQVGGGWSKLGENVGTGGDVNSIFNALVNSPGHYRNMVDGSFNSIGIGIAVGKDGRIYTTHDFASYPGGGSSSSASSKSAAPAKAAAPKAAAAPAKAAAKKAPAPAAAPAAAPQAEAAPAPAAPAPAPLPAPNARIAQSIADVGSIATQG